MTDFVINLFENSDPDRRATETMTVESILEKGVENLEDLHDHPKLHSEMLRVVGRLYSLQRLYYPSKETLEKSLEIGLAAYGENHVEPAITKLELASTLHYLSENDRALTYLLEAKPIIEDRKSTRLNSSHVRISYAVFCLKKKKQIIKN